MSKLAVLPEVPLSVNLALHKVLDEKPSKVIILKFDDEGNLSMDWSDNVEIGDMMHAAFSVSAEANNQMEGEYGDE